MELLVAADSHFYKTPDGKYWCQAIYGYKFWTRYLQSFDKVAIVSRTKTVDFKDVDGFLRVDGPLVRVIELPFMRGMKEYVKNYFIFNKAAKQSVKEASHALFRLPSVSASMVMKHYIRKKLPYAIEIVIDPYDAYSSNRIAQFIYTKKLKKAALDANGVSYVTRYHLQKRYPSYSSIYGESKNKFESYYSTIDLPESYLTTSRTYPETIEKLRIVHTANSINNDSKGHNTLLKTLKKLKDQEYNVEIVFIGDGSQRVKYEEIAKKLNVNDCVTFTGLLSSAEKVRETLIDSDLFIFPTKAEGLPRALIEAMAVGLPCLSTPVNGIPELLEDEYLFEPDDVEGFYEKTIKLIHNPDQLDKMSKNNIRKSMNYVDHKLKKRRIDFYTKLRNLQ